MRRLGPLLALAVLTTLVGCTGGSTPTAPVSSLAPDAPLPRYTTLVELSTVTAAQQKLDKTGKLTIVGGLTGPGQTTINSDGALRYEDAGPAMQLTVRTQSPGQGATDAGLDLVLLPDTAYVRLPASAGAGLPPGKSWLQIQPGSTDPISRQFSQQIQSFRDNADPAKALAQFGDAATIVESTEEPLDGVRAVRYKLRVDLVRAASLQADPAVRQQLEQSIQAGLSTVEFSQWLDAKNRILRVLVDQPLPDNQGSFTLDARFRDWGQPVRIDPPPADQVLQR